VASVGSLSYAAFPVNAIVIGVLVLALIPAVLKPALVTVLCR